MDNLRAFIKEEGWSDEPLRKAWYAEEHKLWYLWFWIAAILLIVAGILFMVGLGFN